MHERSRTRRSHSSEINMPPSKCSICGLSVVTGFNEPLNSKPHVIENESDARKEIDVQKPVLVKDLNLGGGDNIQPSLRLKKIPKKAKSENCVTWARNEHSETTKEVKPVNFSQSHAEVANICVCGDAEELKIGYRNVNFVESQSDEEDSQYSRIIARSSVNACEDETFSSLKSNIPQRPVICPETECSRAVAVESLTSHFYFDHSKVPLMTLEPLKKSTAILNVETLTYGISRCIAFFIVQGDNRSTSINPTNCPLSLLLNRHKASLALPLMASKVPILLPQTDGKPAILEEVFILWLCAVDGVELTYSVTVISHRNEGSSSMSYRGSVYSMREAQEGTSVLQHAECLAVHGAAVRKLLTSDKQLEVDIVIH